MQFEPDAHVGRFIIDRFVKRSISSEEYLAHHSFTNKKVLLHIFTLEPLSIEPYRHYIDTSLHALSRIYLPSLPVMHSSGTVNNRVYYIREITEGISFESKFKATRISEIEEFTKTFIPLVEELKTLYSFGVSFEQLSPEDILYRNECIVFSTYALVLAINPDVARKSSEIEKARADTSGVYHTDFRYPLQECIKTIGKLMFFTLSSGDLDTELKKYYAVAAESNKKRRKRDKEPPPRLLPHVDQAIENIILNTSLAPVKGGYESLSEMLLDLRKVSGGEEIPVPISDTKLEEVEHAEEELTEYEKTYREPRAYPARRKHRVFPYFVLALLLLVLGGLLYYSHLSRVNVSPVAKFKPSVLFAKVNQNVYLDASESFDPDGDSVYYHWSLESPRDLLLAFENNYMQDAFKPSVKLPQPGMYKFRLQVFDGSMFSKPAYGVIKVLPEW